MATFIGDADDNALGGTAGEANTLLGRRGNDTLTGAELADVLDGGRGDDEISAGAGDDTIAVSGLEAFADTVFGGADSGIGRRDTLSNSGTGDLILSGAFAMSSVETLDGNGHAIRFRGGGSLTFTPVLLVGVTRITGTDALDTISGGVSDDRLYGRGGADLLAGGNNFDWLYGGLGADTLVGGRGGDRLFGGIGADTLAGGQRRDGLHGGVDTDTLLGGGKHDRLFGGDAGDRLSGGRGDDRLVGGAGTDILTGGDGADVFLYRAAADSPGTGFADRIADFTVGTDRFDLTAIDAVAGGTDDAFTWLGQVPLSGTAGDLVLRPAAGDPDTWLLLGDTDGDGVADLRVRLTGLGVGTLLGDDDILN